MKAPSPRQISLSLLTVALISLATANLEAARFCLDLIGVVPIVFADK